MDDLKMMQSPREWPCYPVLPIKRSTTKGYWPACAILLADKKPIIYFVGLYSIDALPGRTYGEKLATVERKEYPSFDAIAADGWRVD